MTGQCHRYHEYDSRPTTRNGPPPGAPPGPPPPAAPPATITAAVPSTGASAAVPGNGVDAPKATTDQPMTSSPPHPSAAATGGGTRRSDGAASPSSPPTASSHARVGSEKKAHGCERAVSHTDATNDTTATTASILTAVA